LEARSRKAGAPDDGQPWQAGVYFCESSNVSDFLPYTFTTPTPSTQTQVEFGQYVNGISVMTSQWDFVFDFQQMTILGKSEEGEPQVALRHVERLIMSPQHAKAFHAVLTETLQRYEASFGVVPDLRTAGEES
jgi:hypothetical protein